MNNKIAVGMSGGLDSSMAAYLLKKQGYDVTGFTLKLWDHGSHCCDRADITKAQQFADYLGIKHYVMDLRKEFKKEVIDYFIREYINGRTPNPCVRCNQKIKFGQLFYKLKLFEFDYLSTGHYAKIIKQDRFYLARAKDQKKSQEYFLARIHKNILPKIIFPLAELTKEEIKKTASAIDFDFRTTESQEVCFIKPGTDYYDFITSQIKDQNYAGQIINKQGQVLNRHNCYFKYTIGQRQGLGIGDATPYYVIKIEAKNKNVIIGKREDTYRLKCLAKDLYWYQPEIKRSELFNIKVRYNHKGSQAKIINHNSKCSIHFKEAQHALTPGQLAVFYDNDLVKGSGWIDEILD